MLNWRNDKYLRKIILTSSGFNNIKIGEKFIELINKEAKIINLTDNQALITIGDKTLIFQ